MFISVYGEEEFDKLNYLPKIEIPKEYSDAPPQRLRFEIDKRNNSK